MRSAPFCFGCILGYMGRFLRGCESAIGAQRTVESPSPPEPLPLDRLTSFPLPPTETPSSWRLHRRPRHLHLLRALHRPPPVGVATSAITSAFPSATLSSAVIIAAVAHAVATPAAKHCALTTSHGKRPAKSPNPECLPRLESLMHTSPFASVPETSSGCRAGSCSCKEGARPRFRLIRRHMATRLRVFAAAEHDEEVTRIRRRLETIDPEDLQNRMELFLKLLMQCGHEVLELWVTNGAHYMDN